MYMLDYEPSVSCGCWMKSSSTAFITGTIEHYNPITYGQQLDPNGDYIRHFVPEVKNLPKEYIFCPWMAPIEVQREAGCIVGTDYPHPVVDQCLPIFVVKQSVNNRLTLSQTLEVFMWVKPVKHHNIHVQCSLSTLLYTLVPCCLPQMWSAHF